MLSYIRALYSSPTAGLRVNGHLSNTFHLHNGTRQVYPLSMLLFVLTLEPLLNRIILNPDIKGITITKQTYNLAVFADNLLLLLIRTPHIYTKPAKSSKTLPDFFQPKERLLNIKYLEHEITS